MSTAGLARRRRVPSRSGVLGLGPLAVQVNRRSVLVCLALVLLVVAVGAVSLSVGDYPVPLGRLVDSLLGGGTGFDAFIVRTLRLPRWVTGALAGAALGIGGALFQSLSRNPLGSPDVVGFDNGAATGALVVLLVAQASGSLTSVGSVVGGVGTALVVYLLAMRRGVQGFRLILIGIGVAAMLMSVNSFLLTRADLADAQAAAAYLVGSLNGRTWDQAVPLLVALAVLLGPALWVARELRMLELGDESAVALGVPAERARLGAVLVGVGLTAMSTASVGPVAFVALSAPQIARRLTGVPGPNVVAAALTGALVLTGSDVVAEHLFSQQLPVGVVTGVVGGVYLAWLLTREWRGGRG